MGAACAVVKGRLRRQRNFGGETCCEMQTVRLITCKDNVKVDHGKITDWI
jgi:hypothetical protein